MDNIQPANSKHSLVELFAGIGGAGIALAPAFSTVFANDISPMKADVFRHNHSGTHLDTRSVTKLRAADLPHADLLWASFPCQDHSVQGHRKGFTDGSRGSLVFQVMRLLAELELLGRLPPVLCFENVAGFVSHAEGRDFAALCQSLVSMGYLVGALVVDAERWLPVLRKRVFVVAVRKDIEVPAGLCARVPVAAWHSLPLQDAVAALPLHVRKAWRWWTMPEPTEPRPPLAAMLDEAATWFPAERTARYLSTCNADDTAALELARQLGPVLATMDAQRSPRGPNVERFYRVHTDGVVRCLTAGQAHQRLLLADEGGISMRDFTAAEQARLSGLPDGFLMPASAADARQVVGEGLAIPAVAWLGQHLLAPLAQASRQPGIVRPGTLPAAKQPVRKRRTAESANRVGIKAATVATSLYLYPEDLDRLHREAANDGVPAVEWVLRQLDCTLARRGQPSLRRWVAKRGAGAKAANDEVTAGLAAKKLTTPAAPRFLAGGAGHSSAHYEWWTPRPLVQLLLDALGLEQFDLDSFSPGAALSHVPAKLHYTVADDALLQPWQGVVFANPPYGRGVIEPCVSRCHQAVANGEARMVVGILPVRVETRWWADHVTGCADVIMPARRVSFVDGTGGKGGSPAHATAIALWGATEKEVADIRAAFVGASYMPRVSGEAAA